MLLNFLPKRFVKRYLYRKSGVKSSLIQFGGDQYYGGILVIIPDDPARIKKLTPFINQLKESVNPGILHILCAREQKSVVADIDSQLFTLPYHNFKYGDKRFKAVSKHLKKNTFDLVIYLEDTVSYPKLFLSCVTGAKYRVGINCERLTPFLNISLNLKSETEFDSLYDQLKMHVGI